MSGRKRALGLMLLSMGLGMLMVIMLPSWGFLLAVFLLVIGFWTLFA